MPDTFPLQQTNSETRVMITAIHTFLNDESGATAIEYGLIAALISVAAIAAMGAMGDSLQTLFNTVAGELNNAAGS